MAPCSKLLYIIPSLHNLLWIMTGVSEITCGLRPFSRSSAGTTDAGDTDAGVRAFVNSCTGPMSNAGIDCACARIGHQCRDPLSICDLTHHCKCDERIGYLAASGTVCLAYPTPNTTTTTPCLVVSCATTCPECPTTTTSPSTTCPACPAVTCPTTTTIAPTTTTTTPTTTTTAPPVFTCKMTSPSGWTAPPTSVTALPECGGCVQVTESVPGTIVCPTIPTLLPRNYVQCQYAVFGPAGKKLKTPPGAPSCQNNNLFIDGKTYCNERALPVPAGITIDSSITAVSYTGFSPSDATKCRITVVAV